MPKIAKDAKPVAWFDLRYAPIDGEWDKKIIVVNPEYVELSGLENFLPLYAGEKITDEEAAPHLDKARNKEMRDRKDKHLAHVQHIKRQYGKIPDAE